jgi:hypothetical protein
MEPEPDTGVRRSVRTPNWTTLALIGGLVLLVLLIAFLVSRGNPNQDKLTTNQAQQEQAKAPSPEKLCARQQTYDLIKRELFRRAAQLRGSDQAAFDQLSAYAVLRMENPVMESEDSSTGAVNCSGSLSLDLPPGVGIVGGRRTLNADVDYTVQPAADGSGNVVLLRNADSIIAPLATLARSGASAQPAPGQTAPPSQPMQTQGPSLEPNGEPAQPAPAAPSTTAQQAPEQNRPSSARPSFDCRDARTKGEVAVCSDAGLAALDRNMAAQYGRAMDGASPDQKALLRRTRDRFLAYRDRCPNRSCIGDAYVGRMREIRDIMEGRWQPPR